MGHTPLFALCCTDFGVYTNEGEVMLNAVKKLLANRADPNVSGPEGEPMLYVVTGKIATMMYERELGARNPEPRYVTVMLDQLKLVAQELADSGADVNGCLEHQHRHFRGEARLSTLLHTELKRLLPKNASGGASSSGVKRLREGVCDSYGLRSCEGVRRA